MQLDTELIKRAQKGEHAAFAQVVDGSYDTIFRFALKFTAHVQDAEDVAQLACIKLGQSIASYRFEAAFSSWLYTLVINCARDWRRQQARHFADQLPEEIEDESLDGGESLVRLRQVLALVNDMGAGFRETLVLVAGEGMSHSEAGQRLGVKEATISWRMHQIRARLAAVNGQEVRQ
jgi:RNA polymerase sigma-70 factor (ECF subfamily)